MPNFISRLFGRKIKMRNARCFKRFKADFLVKYFMDKKGEAYITNARDISAGGVRFWSDKPVPPSSLLDVSIFLPFLGRAVNALAQVRRVSRMRGGLLFNVAISFMELNEKDREAINQFAENLSQDKKAQFLIDHADIVMRRK